MRFVQRMVAVFATAGALLAAPVHAAVTQLGFMLDASGSVSTADYNLLRNGLSAAIASLPLDGSVEISIVTYGSSSQQVTAPTVLTAGTLSAIQSAILTHTKAGGGTDTAGAINTLAAMMTGSALFSDPDTKSIMNLATDGVPNSQSAAEAAAAAAFLAGIDAMGIEAIGSGVSSLSALNNMALIAFPDTVTILPINSTSIPNPVNGSFVVPVSDFTQLEAVLLAKVQASVNPPSGVPEPGSLLLTLGALGLMLRAVRRNASKSSLQRVPCLCAPA